MRALLISVMICFALVGCGPEETIKPVVSMTTVDDPGKDVVNRAIALTNAGDHEAAAQLYQKAAEMGNRPAQYFLGLSYARGSGLKQDFKQSFHWLEKAAMGGHPKAMYHLGEMYVHGDGVEIDHVKAMAWFWVGTTLGDRYSEKRLRATAPRLTSEEMGDAQALSKKLNETIPHDMKIKRMQLH